MDVARRFKTIIQEMIDETQQNLLEEGLDELEAIIDAHDNPDVEQAEERYNLLYDETRYNHYIEKEGTDAEEYPDPINRNNGDRSDQPIWVRYYYFPDDEENVRHHFMIGRERDYFFYNLY